MGLVNKQGEQFAIKSIMSSPTKKGSIASRYLESLGQSLAPLPLTSSSKFNSSAKEISDEFQKGKTTTSTQDDDNENLSPIRRLIRERERAAGENASLISRLPKSPTKLKLNSNLEPAPKLNYQKPNLLSKSKQQEDRAELNRIVSGMSQSPSLKNLNKLKSIETKMKNFKGKQTLSSTSGKGSPKRTNTTIETGRKSAQTYEYLCRIAESKNWLEKTLDVQIDPEQEDDNKIIVDFANYLRNGILLAELSKKFSPHSVKKIYYGTSPKVDYKSKSGFQFKYTENINYFFLMLEEMRLPTDYRFELTDLYDLKNFPKVIFCLHALAYMLAVQKKCQKMDHIDDIDFSDTDISKTESNIRGLKIPNFDNFDDIEADEDTEAHYTVVEPDSKDSEELNQQPELQDVQEPPEDLEVKDNEFESATNSLPSSKEILEDDIFDSDVEVKSEDDSVIEIPHTDAEESFEFTATVDDIHKKYETLINEDIHRSPTRSPTKYNPSTSSRYSPLSIDRGEEIALYLEAIINLQAISRGSLLRYQMFVDKFMLKTCRDSLSEFQAILKSQLLRKKLATLKKDLTFHSGGIQKLQSFVKFNKNDERYFKINGALLFHKEEIKQLQSILRGFATRERISEARSELLQSTNAIIKLQSYIRFKAIRDLTSLEIDQIRSITPSVIALQSLIRKKLFNDVTKMSLAKEYSPDEAILILQSVIRGKNLRKLYHLVAKTLNKSLELLVEIQSVGRGGILRNRLNDVLDTLYYQEPKLCELAAVARGRLVRKFIKNRKKELQKEVNSIIAVQSSFRGVLGRFEQDSLLDDLDDTSDEILMLQSIARGKRLRRLFDTKWAHYNKPQNVQKIIKIQSYIRTKNQGSAYRLLTTMENPPLVAIKKFVKLLDESDVEFDEEISLAKSKDLIKKTNDLIVRLEEELDLLDLKIELLTKNKITIDELAASKLHPHTRIEGSSEAAGLPKPTRDKIELYEKMFYLLQTKSGYFVRLFDIIEKHNLQYDIGLSENIENFLLKLFGYSLHQENKKQFSREEYLLLRLTLDAIYHSIDRCSSIDEFKSWNKVETTLRGLVSHKYVWELMIFSYSNLVEQRTLVKDVFGSTVESVFMDKELDLESHPILIYRALVEDEERRTQKPSRKPMDISAQDAIQDPEARDKFVANLGNLREISNEFLLSIENDVAKLPMYIRVLCNEIYKHTTQKYPKESERFHLSIIGKLFMKEYFLPVLFKPENYGITMLNSVVNERINSKIKKNLCEIGKVLYQLVSMRPFSAKNVYLQPLNDYIEQSVELVRRLLKTLIDVKDIDVTYDMSLYDDMISDQKPAISMTVEDCLSFSHLVTKEIDIMAPSRNDVLRNYITQINSMPDNGFRSLDRVSLELIPVTEDDNPVNAKARALFLQVKRCILYLIQVQDGDNLVDLLVSHIEPEHERLFKQVIQEEKKDLKAKNIQKPYSGGLLTIESYDDEKNKTISYDLTKLSYHELKKMTLEKLLELEKLGEVTRQDGFQRLLNEIANDIKAKHTHRLKLKKESEKAAATLSKLKSKQKFLKQQLDSYNHEIDLAIGSLHTSSNKKKSFWTRIFSRQFFYQRELKRNGRLPKFGSYKYSAKYLYDNSILLEVNGMTLLEYEMSASGSSKIPKLDFSFSCDKVGIFEIEMRNGVNVMGGAYQKVTLDDLLSYQYENKKEVSMFKGVAKFDSNALIAFIFRKFYDKH